MSSVALTLWLWLAPGQAPLPAGHPEISPQAHANPSGPSPSDFDSTEPLPAGHPAIDADAALDAGASAVSAKELLARLDQMKAELKDRPKTAEIEFALGNLYYDNARWPEAIDYYRQLLDRADGPLHRYLALRNQPHKALTAGQARCTDSGTPTFATLIAAGDRKASAGDVSAAVVCYQAALFPLSVAMTRQANAWYLIGNDDLSVSVHRRALELIPDDPDSLFFLGAILFESGEGNLERLKQAKQAWTRFLEVVGPQGDPERRALVTKDLVRVQFALDNHGQVPRDAPPQMAAMAVGPIKPPPPPPSLTEAQQKTLAAAVSKGEQALAQKRWKEAREAFAQGRRLDPGNVGAARGEGIALLNLDRLLEAEAALRDALGRDPKDPLALYELGEVFSRGEHYAGAAKFWLQVMAEDPKLAEKLQLSAKIQKAEQLQ